MAETGFGEALRAARGAKGWSQRDLARATGLHQPQVALAERGRDMLVSRLAELAEVLDLELRLVPRAPSERDGAAPDRDRRSAAPAAGQRDFVDTTVESYVREWPLVDPEVFAVVARIMRAGQYLEKSMERIAAAKGINAGEMLLLGALRRMGPPYQATPTELRDFFWISLPGISKRLRRLEDLGLVKRVGSRDDRRKSLVRLTRRGHAVQDDYPLSGEFLAISRLSADALHGLSGSLRRLLLEFEKGAPGEIADMAPWTSGARRSPSAG